MANPTYQFSVLHSNMPNSSTVYWRIVNGTGGNIAVDFPSRDSGTETTDGTRNSSIELEVEENAASGTRGYVLEVATNASYIGKQTYSFDVIDGSVLGATFNPDTTLAIAETDAASTINFTTTGVAAGTIYWNITTDIAGTTEASTDWAAYASGTGVAFTGSAGSFTIDALADAFNDGSTETFYVQLRSGSDSGTILDTRRVDVTDDSQTVPANAPTVAPNTTSPTEGDTVTFTFGEVAGSAAQTYYFDITHGTTVNADFTAVPPGNTPTARTTVTWDGSVFSPTSVAVTLAGAGGADGVDDGETFTGKLFDALGAGSEVATTATITVTDDPAGQTFQFDPTAIVASIGGGNPITGQNTISTITFLQDGSATHVGSKTVGSGSFTSLSETPSIGGDNWTSGTGSTFGDDYQVLFEIFEVDGVTTFSGAEGSGPADAYKIFEDAVQNTSWTQASPIYLPLNADVALECTQFRGGGSAGTQANQVSPGCVISYTVKEWDGVIGNLGTGTTVLTGTFDHLVSATTT